MLFRSRGRRGCAGQERCSARVQRAQHTKGPLSEIASASAKSSNANHVKAYEMCEAGWGEVEDQDGGITCTQDVDVPRSKILEQIPKYDGV